MCPIPDDVTTVCASTAVDIAPEQVEGRSIQAALDQCPIAPAVVLLIPFHTKNPPPMYASLALREALRREDHVLHLVAQDLG